MFAIFKKKKINIIKPKPYDEVGGSFGIEGSVPKSWLLDKLTGIIYNDLSLDLVSLDGVNFLCSSIQTFEHNKDVRELRGRVIFYKTINFDSCNIPFIENSKGRVAIRISGRDEKTQSIFIPIIVKSQNNYKAPKNIVKQHKSLESQILKYKKDIEIYDKKINKLRESRELKSAIYDNEKDNQYFYLNDWSIASDILGIIQDEKIHQKYLYSDEDEAEKKLNKKFKDAIEWRYRACGPICGAGIGTMNGYLFRVYSNDHDTHFHIIHNEKGVEARFLFPEIELLDYKNIKYTMSSKTIKKIQEYFKKPDNFNRLKTEIERRNSA